MAPRVETYQQQAVENGIVAQHTLYPYHFVPDSAALTPVGERDLRVLAEHYRAQPGPLNMPRAGTPEDLYRARVEAVRTDLTGRGVDVARVTWVDGFPGGPGMSTERVVQALKAESEGEREEGMQRPAASGRRPSARRPQASRSDAGNGEQ